MIPDRDIWAAALLIVKRFGDDTMLEAAARADELLENGDMIGSETWRRILNAIERLQARRRRMWRGCISAGNSVGSFRFLKRERALFIGAKSQNCHRPEWPCPLAASIAGQ
jgi:hypothetical protein